jgi:hypothetical protein
MGERARHGSQAGTAHKALKSAIGKDGTDAVMTEWRAAAL